MSYPIVIGSKVEFHVPGRIPSRVEGVILHFKDSLEAIAFVFPHNYENWFSEDPRFTNSSFEIPVSDLTRVPYSELEAKIYFEDIYSFGSDPTGNGYEEYAHLFPVWKDELEQKYLKRKWENFRKKNFPSIFRQVSGNPIIGIYNVGKNIHILDLPEDMADFAGSLATELVKKLYLELGNELPREKV